MKNYLKSLGTVAVFVIGISLAGGFIYGCYWVAKTVSYSFFYEDMVKRTIVQSVKPEALK